MKLALHRSITFWSGLLVILFLGWVWRDSLMHVTTLYHRWDQGGTWAESIAGGFSVKGFPNAPAGEWQWGRDYLTSSNLVAEPFPAPFAVRGGRPPNGGEYDPFARHRKRTYQHDQQLEARHYHAGWKVFFIPYWLILLAVTALWLGLLFWRARRRRIAIPKEARA